MSNHEWTLDPDSELNVIIPWLDGEPDPEMRDRVTRWIAEMVRNPIARGDETHPGVFSRRIVELDTTVIWTLNTEQREVYVAHIGHDAGPN